jgi:hypothetical protein
MSERTRSNRRIVQAALAAMKAPQANLVAWLQRIQLAGGTAPCRYGHVDCSDRDGGRCQDETFHQLLSAGLVDEDGDPVEEAR